MMKIAIRKFYGDHAWVAAIGGRDARYGWARQFLRPVAKEMSRSGATGHLRYVINEGTVYQVGGRKTARDLLGYEAAREGGFFEVRGGQVVPLSLDEVLARFQEE